MTQDTLKPLRVHIIGAADAATSSGHLLVTLGDALHEHANAAVSIVHLNANGGGRLRKLCLLLPSLKRIRAAWKADVVVTHTSVIFSMQEILIARMFGKKVLTLYWDSYPESFAPLGQGIGISLYPYRWIERGLLRLAHKIMPPSDDYLPHLERRGLMSRVHTFKMWPFTATVDLADAETLNIAPQTLQIGFAGAINPIRGLDASLRAIAVSSRVPVVLHIYGQTVPTLPVDLQDVVKSGHLTIQHHGYVEQSEIMDRLARHHLGLVSLSDHYAEPAFPSKTMSYIAAGLPILYIGPPLPHFKDFLVQSGIGVVLDTTLTDLVDAARALNAIRGPSQENVLMTLALNEARIADFLK